jgi:type IV pilus assembly protein PilN
VPEGVYLRKVARTGEELTFNGVAQSNARVSVFMRQIDDDVEFDESQLQVIQRAATAKNFTLGVKESKPENAEGEL